MQFILFLMRLTQFQPDLDYYSGIYNQDYLMVQPVELELVTLNLWIPDKNRRSRVRVTLMLIFHYNFQPGYRLSQWFLIFETNTSIRRNDWYEKTNQEVLSMIHALKSLRIRLKVNLEQIVSKYISGQFDLSSNLSSEICGLLCDS